MPLHVNNASVKDAATSLFSYLTLSQLVQYWTVRATRPPMGRLLEIAGRRMIDESKSAKAVTRRFELAGSADGLHAKFFGGKVHELVQASPCGAPDLWSVAK